MKFEESDDGRTLDMCCGGKRKCPVLHENVDGSFSIADDGKVITMDREQAEAAAAWLGRRLAARVQRDLHDDAPCSA